MSSPSPKPILRIGKDSRTGLPFIQKANNYGGFEYEVAEYVANKLGRRIQLIETPGDKLFEQLQQGNLDIALNAIERPTAGSARFPPEITFTEHYYSSFQQLVVPKKDNFTYNLSDLKGKAVGVLSSSAAEIMLVELNRMKKARMSIRRFPEPEKMFAAMSKKQIQATLSERALAYWYRWKIPNLKLTGEKILEVPFVIVLNKKDQDLRQRINKILKDNREKPDFLKIFKKWHVSSLSK